MVSAAEATRPATDSKVISGGSDDPAASRAYRGSFYACLSRRADALFELADAILTGGRCAFAVPPQPRTHTSPRLGESICGHGQGNPERSDLSFQFN